MGPLGWRSRGALTITLYPLGEGMVPSAAGADLKPAPAKVGKRTMGHNRRTMAIREGPFCCGGGFQTHPHEGWDEDHSHTKGPWPSEKHAPGEWPVDRSAEACVARVEAMKGDSE